MICFRTKKALQSLSFLRLLKRGFDYMTDSSKTSKYEFSMILLATMASENIANRQKISKIKAFSRLIKSKSAELLFDESSGMWLNGSDYIADEYRRDKNRRRNNNK